MKVKYSRRFAKQFKKLPIDIKKAFKDRLEIFLNDNYHPILHNHRLKGDFDGCHSLDISGDYRAIFEEFADGEVIIFSVIGDHHQLYGK
jgi:addiction module RelE/StbE family toxin